MMFMGFGGALFSDKPTLFWIKTSWHRLQMARYPRASCDHLRSLAQSRTSLRCGELNQLSILYNHVCIYIYKYIVITTITITIAINITTTILLLQCHYHYYYYCCYQCYHDWLVVVLLSLLLLLVGGWYSALWGCVEFWYLIFKVATLVMGSYQLPAVEGWGVRWGGVHLRNKLNATQCYVDVHFRVGLHVASLEEVAPSEFAAKDKFGCKWHVVQIRKLLHAETQCQVCQQFDFEKPEQHSVALMLKKNLLKRLLIPVLENTQILMRFFQPIDDKISISL